MLWYNILLLIFFCAQCEIAEINSHFIFFFQVAKEEIVEYAATPTNLSHHVSVSKTLVPSKFVGLKPLPASAVTGSGPTSGVSLTSPVTGVQVTTTNPIPATLLPKQPHPPSAVLASTTHKKDSSNSGSSSGSIIIVKQCQAWRKFYGKKRRIFYYKIKKTDSRIEPLEKKILDDLIKVIYNIDPWKHTHKKSCSPKLILKKSSQPHSVGISWFFCHLEIFWREFINTKCHFHIGSFFTNIWFHVRVAEKLLKSHTVAQFY